MPPFTVSKWRGASKADAVARSSLLRQAFETGRAGTVENRLAVMEDQACDWQAGQHQPDRIAAAVIAHDKLAALATGRMTMGAPPTTGRKAVGTTPPWLKRSLGDRTVR